jgi:hypothetical protein
MSLWAEILNNRLASEAAGNSVETGDRPLVPDFLDGLADLSVGGFCVDGCQEAGVQSALPKACRPLTAGPVDVLDMALSQMLHQ